MIDIPSQNSHGETMTTATTATARNKNILRHILFLFTLLFVHCLSFAATPELQTTETYQEEQDIRGWCMSEKLDGIRGYWDGQQMWTRNGNPIHAPAWFTSGLPPFELDGELWSGRGEFEFILSTVLDDSPSPQWKDVSYNIFEVPHAPGDFRRRLDRAREWFDRNPSDHVRIIVQQNCRGRDHLLRFLKKVGDLGGEGVILKDPHRVYRDGSHQRVLKMKNYSRSSGTVVGFTPGQGRFEDMMGSLTVRLSNGVTFRLGTGFTTEERATPPPLGSTVIFRHCGLTGSGKPRFASFLKIRKN